PGKASGRQPTRGGGPDGTGQAGAPDRAAGAGREVVAGGSAITTQQHAGPLLTRRLPESTGEDRGGEGTAVPGGTDCRGSETTGGVGEGDQCQPRRGRAPPGDGPAPGAER